MSIIRSNSKTEIILDPHGETRKYRFSIGMTGPMQEMGLAIAREDESGRFFSGCIPVEDVDELIKFMCRIRGYHVLELPEKEKSIKYPKQTVVAIL